MASDSSEMENEAQALENLAQQVVFGLGRINYYLSEYEDDLIRITVQRMGPNSGGGICSTQVFILRQRWFSKNAELVLSVGLGNVYAFHPGQWTNHLRGLWEAATTALRARKEKKERDDQQAEQRRRESIFKPVDDSDLFSG